VSASRARRRYQRVADLITVQRERLSRAAALLRAVLEVDAVLVPEREAEHRAAHPRHVRAGRVAKEGLDRALEALARDRAADGLGDVEAQAQQACEQAPGAVRAARADGEATHRRHVLLDPLQCGGGEAGAAAALLARDRDHAGVRAVQRTADDAHEAVELFLALDQRDGRLAVAPRHVEPGGRQGAAGSERRRGLHDVGVVEEAQDDGVLRELFDALERRQAHLAEAESRDVLVMAARAFHVDS